MVALAPPHSPKTLPAIKTLNPYDFNFATSTPRKQIGAGEPHLRAGRKRRVPGLSVVRKTHLAIALSYLAVKKG
jgi:hypothetical protein